MREKIMSNNQAISAGDKSTNLQGKEVTVNQTYNGISYSDVKEIAMDVFKSNFYDLGEKVEGIVYERAETIINKYLEKLNSIDANLIKNTEDPDIRFVIYETQKNHARRGDENIGELLVDVLIKRTMTKNESLKNIVLDEALTIIPKLTLKQIDILSLIFLVKYFNFAVAVPIDFFIIQIKKLKKELVITNNEMFYQHLQYTGCLSISIGCVEFKKIIKTKFPQLNNEEETAKIIVSNPDLSSLEGLWNNTKLCNCSLTSVGIAVAISNIKIKTGLDLDLNIWVKE